MQEFIQLWLAKALVEVLITIGFFAVAIIFVFILGFTSDWRTQRAKKRGKNGNSI